ncbi:MAG: ribonuclease Z [Cytophagaceae bacterium]|nr:ribonuclease Z [Cytophagaceae bacterium]|tara:strand:- start:407 stop:742 length:336 start_codon:yes stop_codon:yes gene_type:complete
MQVTKKETYTILGDEEDGLKEFASFLNFIVPKAYAKDNLIIDILKYEDVDLPALLNFLKPSNTQRGGGKSFVLVNNHINPDIVPEEIMVVPTIQEAIDVIELEEIQRDLGF